MSPKRTVGDITFGLQFMANGLHSGQTIERRLVTAAIGCIHWQRKVGNAADVSSDLEVISI